MFICRYDILHFVTPNDSKEPEMLGFLEKSHCVPILITLDKNGIMNRNQIYAELGETIRVVIKRIELLKEYGLIYETKMTVKPYAKYINLTIKGKKIASRLSQIQSIMEKNFEYPISLFNFRYEPNYPKDFDKVLNYKDYVKKAGIVKTEHDDLTICPKCSNYFHAVNNTGKDEWVCYSCGYRKIALNEEFLKLYVLEMILNPDIVGDCF
jgi:hypothetical protein